MPLAAEIFVTVVTWSLIVMIITLSVAANTVFFGCITVLVVSVKVLTAVCPFGMMVNDVAEAVCTTPEIIL